MMQTMVLKVSLTFDPVKLVAWAKEQKGTCCGCPAHDANVLDYMPPELTAQGIMAHAFFNTVEEIIEDGSVSVLEGGIPQELSDHIEQEYQTAFAEIIPPCDNCGQPATVGFVNNPYAAEINNDTVQQWYCAQCYSNDLDDI